MPPHRGGLWETSSCAETYAFELDAPPESRLSSFRRVREYEWYVRNGTAVRSPVRVDGVGIDDEARRGYERSWLREEERRRAGLLPGDDTRGTESRELVDQGDPAPRFVTDFFCDANRFCAAALPACVDSFPEPRP